MITPVLGPWPPAGRRADGVNDGLIARTTLCPAGRRPEVGVVSAKSLPFDGGDSCPRVERESLKSAAPGARTMLVARRLQASS
jgi:hypothetical protein